jgi:hypothetical protein
MSAFSIFSDVAAKTDGDKLQFSRYLRPLSDILTDPQTETPFTIGIFGAWGSGKTTLLNMLNERLHQDQPDKFVTVYFNPWIHRSEPNLLIPMLHTLSDTLEEDHKHRFVESAKKIGAVLLKLGADLFLKSVTANTVSLEGLEKLEQGYLKERGRAQSELRRLRKTLQAEADAVAAKGAKIVFFIDDLDRCDPAQIIDLLEAVKIFLDLRHVFVVLAVDKEVIDRGIEVKYSKFKFAENRQSALGAEYLEKLVQLPLQLFPLYQRQVRDFVTALAPPQSVLDHLDLLEKLLLPNPRKIKRVVNILSVTNLVMEATDGIAALNLAPELILRLVVLQVQSGDLYAEITKQSDFLVALEEVYAQKLRVDKDQDFAAYGDRAAAIQRLCKIYYRPDTYLSEVFKQSNFAAVKSNLMIYLSMLGG